MKNGELLALLTAIIVSHDAAPDISEAVDVAEEIIESVLLRGWSVNGVLAADVPGLRAKLAANHIWDKS